MVIHSNPDSRWDTGILDYLYGWGGRKKGMTVAGGRDGASNLAKSVVSG